MKLLNKIKGFTLMELLIYVGIFSIAAGLLTGVLFTVLKVQQKESSSTEVTQQLNFVMQTIQRLVKESSAIIVNSTSTDFSNDATTGTSQARLVLRMKDSGANPTTDKDPIVIWKDSSTNVIKMSEGIGSNQKISDLTNNRVIADKLEFMKLVQYPGHDTVSIDMQLTYNSNNIQEKFSRSLRSAIARVSAATFDSNLLPGSNNTFDLGYTGNTWRNAIFSGDLFVGGNVGIGTVTPNMPLSVESSKNNDFTLDVLGDTTSAGKWTGIRLGSAGSGNLKKAGIIFKAIDTWSRGDLQFLVDSAADTGNVTDTDVKMVINNTGNVGIGTTAPISKLQVESSESANYTLSALGDSTQDGRWSGIQLGSSGTGNTKKGGIIYKGIDSWSRGDLIFSLDSGADSSAADLNDAKLTIKNNGNIGIGTTTPAYKLDVNGDIKATGKIYGSKAFSGAFLKKSSNQSLISGTNTKITFDIENYDTNNIHDNTTNNTRLIVPSGVGKVKISGGAGAGPFQLLQIYKNNNSYINNISMSVGQFSNLQQYLFISTPVIEVFAGDYFELLMYTTDPTGTAGFGVTWFAMEIIE